MAPTQYVRQCHTFWEVQIQFSHIQQISPAKSFSVKSCQVFGKLFKKKSPILFFFFAALLKFNDVSTD